MTNNSDPADVLPRFRLDDRVIVISGASSGLGVGLAHACAAAGADVVLAARRVDKLEQTAEAVAARGHAVLTVPTDVTDEAACARLVDAAVERFGRVDGLVNNAGVGDSKPASMMNGADFRATVEVDLTSCFLLARAAMEAMPRGSAIVNVASIMAHTTVDALPTTAYSPAKAGVVALSRTLARQWTGRKGIRVNTVSPGYFPTELTGDLAVRPGGPLGDRIVMGRLGRVDEMAAAVVFLLSDASSYMTGSEVVVDGGFTLS